MARDPMVPLLKLRRLAVDQARQSLADCLAREQMTEKALAEAEAALDRETLAAQASASDGEVEAYAAWLPYGRMAVQKAQSARDAAAVETTLGRAALTLARSAAEAVEKLIEQRRQKNLAEAEQRERKVLDEAGQRRRQAD
jgi:flagellar export protein FliJ